MQRELFEVSKKFRVERIKRCIQVVRKEIANTRNALKRGACLLVDGTQASKQIDLRPHIAERFVCIDQSVHHRRLIDQPLSNSALNCLFKERTANHSHYSLWTGRALPGVQ